MLIQEQFLMDYLSAQRPFTGFRKGHQNPIKPTSIRLAGDLCPDFSKNKQSAGHK